MSFGSINSGGDDTPMAEINVTPLVDVMLVLLIVFMITMPILTHSIPLQLPNARSQDNVHVTEPLRLSIDRNGTYALGEQIESLDTLQAHLRQAAEQNPETVLAIAADKQVSYDAVAQALSAARSAGLSKIGFVTQAPN